MQGQDSGYFVRLGSGGGDTAVAPRPEPPDGGPEPRKRRRHSRRRISPVMVVGLLVGGWLAWAATTPGGISARAEGIADSIQGLLDDATTDPGLHRAATYYNDRYEREGAYPDLSDDQIREDPEAGFGIGVDVEWCSPHALVLQSMSGRGSISRLLLNGKDLGDVTGEQPCPANPADPRPWSVGG